MRDRMLVGSLVVAALSLLASSSVIGKAARACQAFAVNPPTRA